jgi:hypothetical protein
MRRLDVTDLGLTCQGDGSTKVTVWCKCWTVADIDDVIAWLKLARAVMARWQEIRSSEAE